MTRSPAKTRRRRGADDDLFDCPRCEVQLRVDELPDRGCRLSYPHAYPGRCPRCSAGLAVVVGETRRRTIVGIQPSDQVLHAHRVRNPLAFDLIPNRGFWGIVGGVGFLAIVLVAFFPHFWWLWTALVLSSGAVVLAVHLRTARPLAFHERRAFARRIDSGLGTSRLTSVGRTYRG